MIKKIFKNCSSFALYVPYEDNAEATIDLRVLTCTHIVDRKITVKRSKQQKCSQGISINNDKLKVMSFQIKVNNNTFCLYVAPKLARKLAEWFYTNFICPKYLQLVDMARQLCVCPGLDILVGK